MTKFTYGRSLNIIAFNANGIREQTHELESLLYERNIDILLINETHLKPKDKFRLQNYFIYRNDRTDGPMGGTAICVQIQIGRRVIHSSIGCHREQSNLGVRRCPPDLAARPPFCDRHFDVCDLR